MVDALAIAVRAGFYLSVLVAAGSVLCLWLLSSLPFAERTRLRRMAPMAGLLALLLAAAGILLEAIFLAGNDWAAALDAELIGFILDGPKGLSTAVLVAGLVTLPLLFLRHRGTDAIALLGVAAIVASFGLTGHTSAASGGLLSALVILHVLLLSFWVGVFLPLYRLSRLDLAATGAVAHQFGRLATWAVAGLAIAGLITLHQLTGGLVVALATDYGRIFALKLSVFVLVLGFAAYNRVALTPALINAKPQAANHLQRSLILEITLIVAILVITATATTITGPGS